jgi:hypothetical protein
VQESLEEDKESLSFHEKLDFKFITNAYDDSPSKVNLKTLKNSNASTNKSSDASLKSSHEVSGPVILLVRVKRSQ